jgi:thymidine kinase
LSNKIDIILIEEANFFDRSLVDVVKLLLQNDKKIVVSGLDLDFRGNPFGPMGHLLALANEVIKKQAFCEYSNEIGEKCGEIATRTQRLLYGNPAPHSDPLIIVGDGNENDNRSYQARCPKHHIVPR